MDKVRESWLVRKNRPQLDGRLERIGPQFPVERSCQTRSGVSASLAIDVFADTLQKRLLNVAIGFYRRVIVEAGVGPGRRAEAHLSQPPNIYIHYAISNDDGVKIMEFTIILLDFLPFQRCETVARSHLLG